MSRDCIRVRGARQNNLRGFDLDIPLGELVVVTGVSGSGKSSLAFDTIYAEGQRRYVETFSPYARQFLDRMDRPAVDRIDGVLPAIAIDQTNPVRTSRSTVGTMTELNDHLKLLFARTAQLYCGGCGKRVRRDTPEGVAARLLAGHEGERAMVTARVAIPKQSSADTLRDLLAGQGYTRIHAEDGTHLEVVADRIRLTEARRDRLVEALESGFKLGRGHVQVRLLDADRQAGPPQRYSADLHCADCDIHYDEPSPGLFSFNSPVGACETCRGFGRVMGIDYRLVIPDESLSLEDGAVKPFQSGRSAECQDDLLFHARRRGVATDIPFRDLPEADRQWIIEGEGRFNGRKWYGVDGYFNYLERKSYKMHVRVLLSRYRSYDPCPDCQGARLKPTALLWRIGSHEDSDAIIDRGSRHRPHGATLSEHAFHGLPGLHLHDVLTLPLERCARFFDGVHLPAPLDEAAEILLDGIRGRLAYLNTVGLGYLTLDRQSRTLSGGEVQRINLTTALGTALVNTLFVLDEPSIGLHPRDIDRIVTVMHRLRDAGNALLVVEHDPAVMQAADRIIDIGPGPGERGGRVIFNGTPAELLRTEDSLTADYLTGRKRVVALPVSGANNADGGSEAQTDEEGTRSAGPGACSGWNRSGARVEGGEGPQGGRMGEAEPDRCPVDTDPAERAGHGWPAPALPAAQDSAAEQAATGHQARDGLSVDPARSPGKRSSGSTRNTHQAPDSKTAKGVTELPPETPRITIQGATEHNLNDLTVDIPVHPGLVCLTGVSGSGKSTLMRDILYNELSRRKGHPGDPTGALDTLTGDEHIDDVVLVDQSPIGKTTRSNPASYTGALEPIRKAYAAEPLAKERKYTPGVFSFNSGKGRCPTCGGNGFEHVEMQFLSDVYLRCADCNGSRYRPEILEIQRLPDPGADLGNAGDGPRSVAGILDLTVDQAAEFFRATPAVLRSLAPLQAVGLGYLKLGQPVPTLSGGEAQRLKLAGHLAKTSGRRKQRQRLLFLFDEPTTGLHFEDVAVLLRAFQRLQEEGHALLVIEHNLDVMLAADWIIDLGPEGGDQGGRLVCAGTPAHVMARATVSHTGRALAQYVRELERLRATAEASDGSEPDGDEPPTRAGTNGPGPGVSGRGTLQVLPCKLDAGHPWPATPPAGHPRPGAAHTREANPGHDALSQVAETPGDYSVARAANTVAPSPESQHYIDIHHAREHNLKGVDIRIPRNRLTVITGLSGSGKSTVAFDILFNEGQRRYLESLNAYARQFVQPAARADVDRVEGIPPTVAIEQRTSRGGRKSTVATLTEVHHFLRLLYVRLGTWHCPACKVPIQAQTPEAIHVQLLREHRGETLHLLAPMVSGRKGIYKELARWAAGKGHHHLYVDGEFLPTADWPKLDRYREHDIDLPVAELTIGPENAQPLRRAIALTLEQGNGVLRVLTPEQTLHTLSTERACPSCNRSFDEPDPRQFSYNSPHGWCPTCHGTGEVLEGFSEEDTGEEAHWQDAADEDATPVPCPTCDGARLNAEARAVTFQGRTLPELSALTVRQARTWFADLMAAENAETSSMPRSEGAPPETAERGVVPRAAGPSGARSAGGSGPEGGRMGEAEPDRCPVDTDPAERAGQGWPAPALPAAQDSAAEQAATGRQARDGLSADPASGTEKRSSAPAHAAPRPASRPIVANPRTESEPVAGHAEPLTLSDREATIARDVLPEIHHRLTFLEDVGLGYLSLDRAAPTLSGGEAQRIRLAAQLGSNLQGVCYVMDEPTIGLHPRDNRLLLDVLARLEGKGNTIVVVEHDEETIRRAEHIIDLGPGAGVNGGRVVAAGTIDELLRHPRSITGRYLRAPLQHPLRGERRPVGLTTIPAGPAPPPADSARTLTLRAPTLHNLQGQDLQLPLGRLVVVTGVSGSGKSSLIRGVLKPALKRLLSHKRDPQPPAPAHCDGLEGWQAVDRVLEVDQTPIGKTPRSCPATYVGFWDAIRKLFAGTQEASLRGYGPGRFSFNTKEGRCPDCDGQGVRRIEMNFLPDVSVPCETCHGLRFTRETLAVEWKGRHIGDVLNMSVEEAVPFFSAQPRIHHPLTLLEAVGLGYLTLGQASPTLSGGEAQRIKLVTELAKARPDLRAQRMPHTLYVLDEPTVGLHMADVERLIEALQRLVDAGHSVVVIEHNLDLIAEADCVVDIGPEGGDAGGRVVACGPPETVAAAATATGRFLAELMQRGAG